MAGEWDSTSRRESRVPVGGWASAILRKIKIFFRTAIRTAIRAQKRKPPFGAVCKVLILLMLWWTR
jgi:hypothetical protein